jgi:hypothetical protein
VVRNSLDVFDPPPVFAGAIQVNASISNGFRMLLNKRLNAESLIEVTEDGFLNHRAAHAKGRPCEEFCREIADDL